MDADSSYGGSDTAQDSTCGNENNSLEHSTLTSQNDALHNKTNLVSTISINNEENPYYNKNEITLPINPDETDFKSEHSPKLPHYLSTANLNINETLEHHSNLEAMSKQYKSTSYLNAESPPIHRKSGLDNPGFDAEESVPQEKQNIKSSFDQSKPYNGDLNLSLNSSTKNDEPLTEAVNLELINMKPSGKDVTGLYENGTTNGMTSIPLKPDADAEMGNPYDEYFVPVNEHKKYMRGEKLYVTMDKRNVKKKSKCLCWGVCISIVLAAVIVGILAAVGVIGNKPVQEVSSRQFSGSAPEIKTSGIFGLPSDVNTENSTPPDSPSSMYTPGPPSSTAPYPLTTEMSEISVPRALESQIKIDNLEFDPEYLDKNSTKFKDLAATLEEQLKETIFTLNELYYGPADIEVKIMDFSEGSVIARYRIVWKFKEGLHNTKDPIDIPTLEKRMTKKMLENDGFLSAFQLNEEALMNITTRVLDSCKIHNFDCEHECRFNYDTAEFTCVCPEDQVLMTDGKHCHIRPVPTPEPEPEPASEPILEPTAEPEPSKPKEEPIPEPTVEPIPEPTVEPEPSKPKEEPIPEPTVESEPSKPKEEPIPEPTVEPEPSKPKEEPIPEPTVEPEPSKPEPTVEPEPSKPKEEPIPEPTFQTEAPEPSGPIPEPTFEPIEPIAEPTAEPELSKTLEPIPEPTSEPEPEPTSEPASEPTTKAQTAGTLKTTSDPKPSPNMEVEDESTTQPPMIDVISKTTTAEPTSKPFEPSTEPEPVTEVEYIPQMKDESGRTSTEHSGRLQFSTEPEPISEPEPTPEPISEPEPTPEPNPEPEPTSEPVSEPVNTERPQTKPSVDGTTTEPVAQPEPTPEDIPTVKNESELYSHPESSSNDEEVTRKENEVLTMVQTTTAVPQPSSSENYEPVAGEKMLNVSSTTQEPPVTLNANLFGDSSPKEISTEAESETIVATNNTTGGLKSEKLMEIAASQEILQITTARDVEEVTEKVAVKPTETHQNVLLTEPFEYSNNLDNMSPFLPEIENDTFINSLRSDEHFVDNFVNQSNQESNEDHLLTTKPPRLDNDQLNKTNPLDPNPTDAVLIDHQKMEDVTTGIPVTDEALINSFRVGKADTEDLNTTFQNLPTERRVNESVTTTEKIAPEIVNNVHSNSFFEKFSETDVDEKTSPPETTFEISTQGLETMKPDINSIPEEVFDTSTLTSTELTSTEEDTKFSTTTDKELNDISISTEDLIAMETTTNGLRVSPEKTLDIKSRSIKHKNKETELKQNLVSERKKDQSEINNEFEDNFQSYAVQEEVQDSSTTPRLFGTKPTTKSSHILNLLPDDNETYHTDSESTNSLNDIFNEDLKQSNVYGDIKQTTIEEMRTTTFSNSKIEEEENFEQIMKKNKHKKARLDDPVLTTVNELMTKSTSEVKPVTEGYTLPKFSRCDASQFQCVNGTSKSNGSYCVPISDRCDSVEDCTDGSDEEGCEEEGCLNNFKCTSGQCLKRHLVCDGIVNCNDGSDEVSCESWSCTPTEFSCGTHLRCIPANWRCDGRSQCRDGSDERDCNAKECPDNQFRCTQQDTCIPETWRCDGKPDCMDAEDERDCECNTDEFKCKMGGGCVKLEKVCDGVHDCEDRSDEWNCLAVQESTAILKARRNNETAFVCSDNWNSTYSDLVCSTMGYVSSIGYEEMEKPSDASKLLKLKEGGGVGSSIIAVLEEASSCEKILAVKCQHNVCGVNIDTTDEGAISNQTFEWSGLSLLYNNKQNIYCTTSLVTPFWAIAAYSCVLGSQNEGKMAPDNWVLKIRGEEKSVTDIIVHPKVKYSNFYYNNDVVLIKLNQSLMTTASLCLPQEPVKDSQACVVTGWKKNAPGDLTKEQYVNNLTTPFVSIQECNSTKHYNGMMSPDEICVESNDEDSVPCYDDVGAPLICLSETTKKWELQGILSHSNKCGPNSHPLVYTSISKDLIAWIKNTIGQAISATSA